jgi:hypothetical protein
LALADAALYPRQLPSTAVEGFLTVLPLRVEEVGEQELPPHGEIHLVTVSSPCQGMLRANKNALGLEDRRSKCVEEAWRILTLLLERQARPPGYTFEMVDARDHLSAKAREGFATFVQMASGDSEGFVAVDPQSWAHRRIGSGCSAQIWRQWQGSGSATRPMTGNGRWTGRRLRTAWIRAEWSTPQGSMTRSQVGAFYPMNVAGRPIRVFPMLVATEESYAFRQDEEGRPGQGMVYDRQLRGWVEPNNE